MKQEEIEKAAIKYDRELKTHPLSSEALREDLVKFGQIVNNYWQEKTRWKSLITEPPTEFGENKQIFIKHKNSEISVCLLYSNRSAEHTVELGFVEWKEVD